MINHLVALCIARYLWLLSDDALLHAVVLLQHMGCWEEVYRPFTCICGRKITSGKSLIIVTSKWYISCLEYKPKKKYQVQCTAYFKQKYGDSSSGWTNTSSMEREKVLFICLLFLFLSCVGAIWIYRWCIYKTIYARLPVLVEVNSDMPIYGCFWTLLLFDYDFPKERIRMIRDR